MKSVLFLPIAVVSLLSIACLRAEYDALDTSTPIGWLLFSRFLPAQAAAASDPLFVAVGTGGKIFYSANGVSWTEAVSPVAVELKDVAWCAGRFVGVGGSGTGIVVYSTDGKTWSTALVGGPVALGGVTCSGTRFVTNQANDADSYYTDDAITWTQTSPPSGNNQKDVSFGLSKYVAGDSSGSGTVSADNGQTWATSMPIDAGSGNLNSMSFLNNTFFATSDGSSGNNLFFATDPTTSPWTSVNAGGSAAPVTGITFGNGQYLAIEGSSSGQYFTSTDGSTWSTALFIGVTASLYGLAYGVNKYIVAGDLGGSFLIYSSADGSTWTDASPVGTGTINAVTFRP